MEHADTTRLLIEARGGSRAANDALLGHLYEELRELAHRQLGRRSGDTLQSTELVHEAYLKLCVGDRLSANDRRHFFALAARAMRQILVDRFRARATQKRGGLQEPLPLNEGSISLAGSGEVILAINEALLKLASLSARTARVVELRFFGGLTEAEIGETLEVSERTVAREWRTARAWLTRELSAR